MTAEESEFVQLVKALPQRERLIFFEITFNGRTPEDIAFAMNLSPKRIEEIYEECCRKVGLE